MLVAHRPSPPLASYVESLWCYHGHQVAALKEQLKAKDQELFLTRDRLAVFQSNAKAFCYAAGTSVCSSG